MKKNDNAKVRKHLATAATTKTLNTSLIFCFLLLPNSSTHENGYFFTFFPFLFLTPYSFFSFSFYRIENLSTNILPSFSSSLSYSSPIFFSNFSGRGKGKKREESESKYGGEKKKEIKGNEKERRRKG
jgi:hypothetical protein